MALTTTQLRRAWDPPCRGTRESLAEAYRHLDRILQKYNYRPRSGVTGAYNCRAITGGTGYSLHAYGPGGIYTFWTDVRVSMAIAVDINWDKNPYGPTLITDMPRAMVEEIKALRTNNGKQVWRWGGDYVNNKDAMHYEIVCAPADIATGIRGGVSPPTPKEYGKMIVLYRPDGSIDTFAIKKSNGHCWHYYTPGHYEFNKSMAEDLGGVLKDVSAAWDSTHTWLLVSGIGTDDSIWSNLWGPHFNGPPSWAGWAETINADLS